MSQVSGSSNNPRDGGGDSTPPGINSTRRQKFLDIVKQSHTACQNGDFLAAVTLYSEALKIDPNNHVLYSNRSAALIKIGQFVRALQDAKKAKELNPKWSKAYYRQGVALQCLGKHTDALAAFSTGLTEDPKSLQLLNGLIEAATKSPLKAKFEPTFECLSSMKLANSPFVVVSVIGQELLASNQYPAAVVVLENALKIGTNNIKLKGSVYSALASAYWALNSLEKAIDYMQQDLGVAKSLGDAAGECRAQGNLGSAYFSQARYKDALTSHRYQLVLAMKIKNTQAAASALTCLGHVYAAIGDYSNALASHKQCVQLVKQMGDLLQEGKEIGNVGSVYLAMGDFDNAIDCHMEHLKISTQLGHRVEEARAYSNLGSTYHCRRNFERAMTFHNDVLKIAKQVGDKNIEARAYAGLGHAARCLGDYGMAKSWHSKQLDIALATKDKVNEGRACSNLGIVFQLLGDYDAALKLHQSHLNIAISLHDRTGMGRAFGNIGNAFNAMGHYDQAIKYHKQELAISKQVSDRSSEAATHGNLAAAFQSLGMFDKALVHYRSHLSISRELKDTNGEACALLNLGNCHSSMGDFVKAIPFYENYLMLSQELNDTEGESKACHFLGFAHYSLGHYKEAVRYYDQDLCLAKELEHTQNIARAYCNLGLTYLALDNMEEALECQKYFLAVSHTMKDLHGKYRALGNIGEILLKMKKPEEAVKLLHKQVVLAKGCNNKTLEANAYSALGSAYRIMKRFDLALGFHTQELTLLQEINSLKGECRAHGNLGAVHMSLGNITSAIKCYEEMLDRAKDLKDPVIEAQAYGNLGIARINIGSYEEAAGFFEHQLTVLDSMSPSASSSNPSLIIEKDRAYGYLGDCFSSMNNYEDAIRCYDRFLQSACKRGNFHEQEKTYKSLALACKAVGNTQATLSYLEKRIGVIYRLTSDTNSKEEDMLKLKGSCLSDLGQEYLELRNSEQAINCFQEYLSLSQQLQDRTMEAEAVSFLGKVCQAMGKQAEALQYYDLDLRISKELNSVAGKARAYGNIGLIHETMGNFEEALLYREHHLNAATVLGNTLEEAVAFGAIGRLHHVLGNNVQAVAYLQQSLQLAEKVNAKEEEANIRHLLGLAFWRQGDLESAQAHIEKSSDILESIRQNVALGTDHSLILFDRQIVTYQALQKILVQMGRTDLTLLFAEKSKTLATLMVFENRRSKTAYSEPGLFDPFPMMRFPNIPFNNMDSLIQRVSRHRIAVLYFSIAGCYLYSWLLIPERGIVKFNESCISNEEDDDGVTDMGTLLEKYIQGTRDALGIDFNGERDDSQAENPDLWSQHLEELGDKLKQENDKTGFLRMVSRNHRFNCSSYSLSSLFSVGSATGSVKSASNSRPGSTRSIRSSWQGPSSLRCLYQMLIAPFEDELSVLSQTCVKELALVVETDLLLVPFPILRNCAKDEYLCERFKLIIAPSISSFRHYSRRPTKFDKSNPLIVGNPLLNPSIIDQWEWTDIPRAQSEASMVGEVLQCQPLTGAKATKESILNEITKAECIHFATHISWKLSGIVLSPRPGVSGEGNPTETTGSLPPFPEYLLTAADILKLKLTSLKLVVLSSCHTRNRTGLASAESIMGLTKTFLAAGAMCVLVTLWPVPETASKIFFRALYSSLLQGSKVSHALTEAMLTVQHTKHFAHPANWAGYLLVGSDVQLAKNVTRTSEALKELAKTPERSRDSLRVILHLIEKSLQRIHNGQKNAMYTTQKSIENKVGAASGWKELLMSVGFRFEPASNGLPAAVFFPQTDAGERLTKCSENLKAILGLSSHSWNSLSNLLSAPEAVTRVMSILRQVIADMATKGEEEEKVEAKVDVKLWGIVGCHELLASLGFDLIEFGRNEVTIAVGEEVTVRMLQLALQAALAIFEADEPSHPLERTSSLESLELDTDDLFTSLNIRKSATKSARHDIPLAKGAFTSYVRTRGEPDGHTNTGLESAKSNGKLDARHKTPSNKSMLPPLRKSTSLIHPTYQNMLQGTDSSSSSSSVLDWDSSTTCGQPRPKCRNTNNEICPVSDGEVTITSFPSGRKPGRFVQRMARHFSSHMSSSSAKRVTWKMNERRNNAHTADTTSWESPRAPPSNKREKNRSYARPSLGGADIPLHEFHQDRNLGLGLAPSLSKILLSSQFNIGNSDAGNKSDIEGGNGLDDTLSTFDHFSLIDDSAAESSSVRIKSPTKGKGRNLPRKEINEEQNNHKQAPKNGSGPFVTTAEVSPGLNYAELPQENMSGSSTSSSKSSPSGLSKERDEGDGRSLTDSQYGSYSPSMAQNDSVHNTANMYHFSSPRNKSYELQGPNSNILFTSGHYVKDGQSQNPDQVNGNQQSNAFLNQKSSQC